MCKRPRLYYRSVVRLTLLFAVARIVSRVIAPLFARFSRIPLVLISCENESAILFASPEYHGFG
jgi:hypothetical protein